MNIYYICFVFVTVGITPIIIILGFGFFEMIFSCDFIEESSQSSCNDYVFVGRIGIVLASIVFMVMNLSLGSSYFLSESQQNGLGVGS